jgi:hypothetical protein
LGASDKPAFTFDDTVGQSGVLQYYVAAFNGSGEAQSNLAAVTVAADDCGPGPGPTSNPKVRYADGILVVPPEFTLAYLYASLDDGPWTRLPEGDGFFAPEHGNVDLRTYLAPLIKVHPEARLADLKVWGWDGAGQLTDLGSLSVSLDTTSLEYCNLFPEACTGDQASTNWTDDPGVVGSDLPDASQIVTFRFEANTLGADAVLVQISSEPFSAEYQLDSPYLVSSYALSAKEHNGFIYGQFPIYFYALGLPASDGNSTNFFVSQWNLLNHYGSADSSSIFDQDLIGALNKDAIGAAMLHGFPAPTYYIRVIPWHLDGPVGKPSNTIAMTHKALGDTTPLIITDQPPLYDIQIVDFVPEQQINFDLYGCVQVISIDQAGLTLWAYQNTPPATAQDFVQFFYNHLASGEPICPPAYQMPDPGVMDELVEAFSSMWGAIVDLWNSVKNTVVEVVAEALNSVSGLCESTECRDRLMQGLNLAITYFTGLPADLPSFEELTDSGLNYGVSLAVQQAGVDCDAACIAKVRSSYQTIHDMIAQRSSEPACFQGNGGYHGKARLCMPDGVQVKPIPGAGYVPAAAVLQVTRNNYLTVYSARQYDFSLQLSSQVHHDGLPEGQTFSCPFGYYDNMQGYTEFPAPDPVDWYVFQPISIPLPANVLPGTQFTIPVTLVNAFKANTDSFTYPPFAAFQKKHPAIIDGAVPFCSARFVDSPGAVYTIHAEEICTDKLTNQSAPCAAVENARTEDTEQFAP